MTRCARKVLIVDDEPNIVTSLTFLMKKSGFETSVARDGDEALAEVERFRPDLVLLDVMMPQPRRFRGLPEAAGRRPDRAQDRHADRQGPGDGGRQGPRGRCGRLRHQAVLDPGPRRAGHRAAGRRVSTVNPVRGRGGLLVRWPSAMSSSPGAGAGRAAWSGLGARAARSRSARRWRGQAATLRPLAAAGAGGPDLAAHATRSAAIPRPRAASPPTPACCSAPTPTTDLDPRARPSSRAGRGGERAGASDGASPSARSRGRSARRGPRRAGAQPARRPDGRPRRRRPRLQPRRADPALQPRGPPRAR